MDDKFGSRTPAVIGRHHDDIGQPLTIAPFHVPKESPISIHADLPFALIDIMRHIIRQAGKHFLPIAIIECGVIAFKKIDRFLAGHIF